MLLPMTRLLMICLLVIAQATDAFGHEPAYGRRGMIVTQQALATDVGVRVLQSGGNAVDAAVAVGFALAVVHPFAGNLGGGGFMLIRLADGRTTFIDFRETAPAKAARNMYLDVGGRLTTDSVYGWRASGVPGTVRGLELAHNKYGHKPWAELVEPAIALARKGFPVSHWQIESWRHYERSLSACPESKRVFLKNGAFYNWQETFRQPDLARTLERIASRGARDFYVGKTARLLADAMAANGGLITLEDLRRYRAIERHPLEGDYKGYHIITSPPPSSGGLGLLQMLAMLEGTGYEKHGPASADEYHWLAEVMRRFFADRNAYLGDPGFVHNPVSRLLDRAYIANRRSSIRPDAATPSHEIHPGLGGSAAETLEGRQTTHYSIVDGQGNAVAVTYTLNNGYGSGVTVPGAGFLLNDEMDDFACKPGAPNLFGLVQGEANAIAPGKRPLSSMAPTIVTRDGKLFLVLGAPGGPTIITAVLQVLVNVMDFGMKVQDAIDFPRIHHQWRPDRLEVERGVSPDTIGLLKAMGYHIQEAHPVVLARVEAIEVSDGWLLGGHDPRGPGKASGY
jgi:gamma-glutamyltranspeptidase / glutathione hydrolase